MIEIKELVKIYGDMTVLDKVSFTLRDGCVCGLLGLNGAGKSTLMKIICGLCASNDGEVLIDGEIVTTAKLSDEIGAMIETPPFYPSLTGWQNLDLLCTLCGLPKTRVKEVLDIVGLVTYKTMTYKKYSLGMKQRLYFASVLLKKPKIYLLDEPFSNVDPLTVRLFEDLIKIAVKGGAIVLISGHIIAEMKNICDCAVILDGGKMVKFMPDLREEDLESTFFASVNGGRTL